MRKQLKTDVRCWTTAFYNKVYKNETPVSFRKSVEIIEQMHFHMIDHLFSKQRPIQLRKSIGYLELHKRKPMSLSRYIPDWKKAREKGKMVKQFNFHTSGYIFAIHFAFSSYGNWRLFKFNALRKHKRELAKRIFNKDVQ